MSDCRWFGIWLGLILFLGCNQAQSELETAANKKYAPADAPIAVEDPPSSAPDAETGDESRSPAVDERQRVSPSADSPPSAGGPSASSSSEDADSPVADEGAADEGAAEEGATDEPKTLAEFESKIRESSTKNDANETLAWIEKARVAFPDEPNLRLNQLYLHMILDDEFAEKGDRDAAAARFLETGKLARAFPEGERGGRAALLLSFATLNEARGFAQQGQTAEAAQSLERAFQGGFNKLEVVARDPFFEPVREQPEFRAVVDRLQAKRMAELKEKAKEQLAQFEPFEFDFELPNLDDMPVKMADYRGKLLIVDVWGTWCPPCRMEIPHFVQLKTEFPDDLDVVGITYERAEKAEAVVMIRDFMQEAKVNYQCVLGDEATQARIPDLSAFPTTLLVDRAGKVRLKLVGYHPYDELRIYIDALLAESQETGAETGDRQE